MLYLGGVNPKETVNISLTQVGGSSADLIGASVTITNDDSSETIYTGTWNGSILTAEIGVGINYTISCSSVIGYTAPTISDRADTFLKDVTLQYKMLGVYIEATDGTLYTSSTWSGSGKTANSIVVVTENHTVRMALIEIRKVIADTNTDPMENYCHVVADKTQDFDGLTNTTEIRSYNIAYNTDDNDHAAPYCLSYTFPDNVTKGYIPAWGELNIVNANYQAVNTCLSATGVALRIVYNGIGHPYFTSSFKGVYTDSRKWRTFYSIYDVYTDVTPNNSGYYTIPFAKYEV